MNDTNISYLLLSLRMITPNDDNRWNQHINFHFFSKPKTHFVHPPLTICYSLFLVCTKEKQYAAPPLMCTTSLGMCRPAHYTHAYKSISRVNPTPYVLVTICPMPMCAYPHMLSWSCVLVICMYAHYTHKPPWPTTMPPAHAMSATVLGFPTIPTL